MVAALLHHDGGKSQCTQGLTGPPVPIDSHLQRALGIIDRGIHSECDHQRGGLEVTGDVYGALDGRDPYLVPGPRRERLVEVGPDSGIAPGLVREADVMWKPAGTRIDVHRGREDIGPLVEDRL